MYSSENRRAMGAVPWTLDELEVPVRFPSFTSDVDTASTDHEDTVPEFTASRDDDYARGVADGERAMRAEFEASVVSALTALADAVGRVQLHEAPWVANAEENLAAMSVIVARHLIDREVTADGSIVTELVRRALLQLPLDQTVSIRLHPDDIAICEPLLSADPGGRTRDLRLIMDPTVQRGGCLVEGRERVIDGRVDTSLERAYRTLGQVLA